jgi:PAP2 superfamily
MRLLSILSSPALIGTSAIFLSVVWMIRNQKDTVRPMLVFALVLNLIFGTLLHLFMGTEGSLLPWKYDHILIRLDGSLGFSAAAIARPLQHVCLTPLIVIYQLMVPMMICWFLVTRYRCGRGSVILAYIVELVAGPIMYAIVPACGPIYAFGTQWLQPRTVLASPIQLTGLPNSFPSLHVGTAFVFVLFSPNRFWKTVSLAFLGGTILATLATGEHYVIDLIPGLALGCFAVSVARRMIGRAVLFLSTTLGWSLAVRFAYIFLIAHPGVTASFVTLTLVMAAAAVVSEWSIPHLQKAGIAMAHQE